VKRATAIGVLAAAVASSAAAWSSSSSSAAGDVEPNTVRATPAQQLQQARAATKRFQSVVVARRAGYSQSAPCIDGKGIHYRNLKLYREPGVHPARPEMLLYEPTSKGLVLVGVEYEQPDADQRLDTNADRPRLFGVRFDGPLDAHPTGPQKIHYHLHVWLWKANPSRLTEEFHPKVGCR